MVRQKKKKKKRQKRQQQQIKKKERKKEKAYGLNDSTSQPSPRETKMEGKSIT